MTDPLSEILAFGGGSSTKPTGRDLMGVTPGRSVRYASQDLKRILAIPRRTVTDVDRAAMVQIMGARLRRDRNPPGQCLCASEGRPCITTLKPVQAQALYEMAVVGGLLGHIGVGCGKTGLDILAPMVMSGVRTAVLMVPPKLVSQIKRDYLLWREHWRVPSLIIRTTLVGMEPGAPVIHVLPYSRLSRAESAAALVQLAPDLIIADEADELRNADTARGGRFLRHFADNTGTRLCAWSGTLTNKSIKDYSHLAVLSLRERSPLPLDPNLVSDWASAIDPPPPGQDPAEPGGLVALCRPGEDVRAAFSRRLLDTQGVVATSISDVDASLRMHERKVKEIPVAIADALRDCRVNKVRPDGEEFIDTFSMLRCARELAAGFFYRWEFPNGEPKALIEEWIAKRKAWHYDVRCALEVRRPGLDSSKMLALAAKRHLEGYRAAPGVEPLPTWDCKSWKPWKDIRPLVNPVSVPVWIDDFLVNDAANWAHSHRGVVWYEHRAFGERLAKAAQLPQHKGGPDAGRLIRLERGTRSIIASRVSHGRGLDGLQYYFDQQLVANPPESRTTGGAALWEQLLGRLHREGFDGPVVHTHIYRHTPETRMAWDRAKQLARYVSETVQQFQKLLCCDETW